MNKPLKTINRAYSTIECKAIDEENRTIRGIATTPQADRVGDIVVSEGAEFELPIPLLWHHRSDQPVGNVISAEVTKKGIEIVAQLPKILDAGKLKERVDEAWDTIKAGLVRGLSIGFKSLESEPIKSDKDKEDPFAWLFGPRKHTKWLWLELSAVTIPANASASITQIKALDRAALGIKTSVSLNLPGVAGPSKKDDDMTLAEQIVALEKARDEKTAKMQNIMQKSIDEGRSSDEGEREEFDTLQAEAETVEGDIKRLKSLEAIQASKASQVKAHNAVSAAGSRAQPIVVRELQKPLPKDGIRMARLVRCLGLAQGNRWNAAQIAEQLYKDDPAIASVLKATVVAGSTSTDSGMWGHQLVGDETSIFADFVEYLRPRTIVGRFGTGGIPALRNVPFRTALVGQTSGGQGYWVGEGKAKPLTSFDFERRTLEPLKVAAIAVITMELLRDSSPNAEPLIRTGLVDACRERIDLDFINPDKAAVAGVSPASILNGITPIGSSVGGDADSIRADVRALVSAFIAANNPPSSAVWIMSSQLALSLGMLQNPLGQVEFGGITRDGGTFFNIPVLTSEYVTPNTSGDFVALINAQDIYFADEGDFQVDMSTEASLEMSDAPTQDALVPTASQTVSLWQNNLIGFRAERTLNWMRRRDSGVQWLTNVNWGGAVTGP